MDWTVVTPFLLCSLMIPSFRWTRAFRMTVLNLNHPESPESPWEEGVWFSQFWVTGTSQEAEPSESSGKFRYVLDPQFCMFWKLSWSVPLETSRSPHLQGSSILWQALERGNLLQARFDVCLFRAEHHRNELTSACVKLSDLAFHSSTCFCKVPDMFHTLLMHAYFVTGYLTSTNKYASS